jgi:hypothetical protein
MPVSIWDVGEARLAAALSKLDGDDRAKAERDRDALFANPIDHGLPILGEWKGDDNAPLDSKFTVLGGRIIVRYGVSEGDPRPAVIEAYDIREMRFPSSL